MPLMTAPFVLAGLGMRWLSSSTRRHQCIRSSARSRGGHALSRCSISYVVSTTSAVSSGARSGAGLRLAASP